MNLSLTLYRVFHITEQSYIFERLETETKNVKSKIKCF